MPIEPMSYILMAVSTETTSSIVEKFLSETPLFERSENDTVKLTKPIELGVAKERARLFPELKGDAGQYIRDYLEDYETLVYSGLQIKTAREMVSFIYHPRMHIANETELEEYIFDVEDDIIESIVRSGLVHYLEYRSVSIEDLNFNIGAGEKATQKTPKELYQDINEDGRPIPYLELPL